MKHIPCVAAVRIARPAAADCAAPDAIIAVLVVVDLALMTAAGVVEPVLATAKGHALEAAAHRAEELAGGMAVPVTVQQLVEWIVLEGAKEIAAVYALRIVERPVYQHLEHLNCRR
jgi:hypothetical protein